MSEKTISIRDQIEHEAKSAIWQHAFLRWENAALLAMAILLTRFYPHLFPGWPVWGWSVLALIGIVLLVLSSLTDQEDAAEVVSGLFRERFNPNHLQDRRLRDQVEQALAYHQRINLIVHRQRKGLLRDRLQQTVAKVDDWIADIFSLATRLQTYQQDNIIRMDRQRVPGEISDLQRKLKQEINPDLAKEMKKTLQTLQNQWHTLEQLDDLMERANLQLEHSLAALGTAYSQVLLISNRQVESDQAEQLDRDIEVEIHALEDISETIRKMYQ